MLYIFILLPCTGICQIKRHLLKVVCYLVNQTHYLYQFGCVSVLGCVLCLPCPEHSVFEPKNKYCIWTGTAAPFFSADAQCRSVGGYMLVLDVHIYDFLKNSSTLRYQYVMNAGCSAVVDLFVILFSPMVMRIPLVGTNQELVVFDALYGNINSLSQ